MNTAAPIGAKEGTSGSHTTCSCNLGMNICTPLNSDVMFAFTAGNNGGGLPDGNFHGGLWGMDGVFTM